VLDVAVVAVWPAAAVAATVLPRRWGGTAIALATVVTTALPADYDPWFYFFRPFGLDQATLLVLGVIAIVCLPEHPSGRLRRRLAALALAAGGTLAVVLVPVWWETHASPGEYGSALVAVMPCAVAMVAGYRAMRGPFGRRWARGAVAWSVAGAWLTLTMLDYTQVLAGLVLLGVLGGTLVVAAVRGRRRVVPAGDAAAQ
jgi:hypothetical protein